MKKYLNYSFGYAVLAMLAGVFYREFTKWNHFTEPTSLGKVHGHLFMLGAVVFFLIALFAEHHNLKEQKTFRVFMILYNIGVPAASAMMLLRGILQVLGIQLSEAFDKSLSGIAGISHIFIGIGFVLLYLAMRNTVTDKGGI